MKKIRKLSGLLPAVMAAGLILAFPAAECFASGQGTGNLVQMVSKTRLDVSKGDIKIGPYGISGTSPEGKKETQANPEGYHITGETSNYSITVEEGVSTEILLENVNISLVDTDACALLIEETSRGDVTVILRGYNVLKSGSHCAGIQKSCNQTTCVRSGSSCTCGTLTIQCEKAGEEEHVCDETCGTLIASGVNGGAGIGGGDGRKTNYIRILGGHISTSGGYGGAGIGGGYFCDGSHVEITGGEVTAVSGEGNVALGGLAGSDYNLINGDCIVDAGSMGGTEVRRGIVLNGNSGTITGVVHISKNAAMGILKDKVLTREEGGRMVLPEGVFVTTQNTLRASSGLSSEDSDSSGEGKEQETGTSVSPNTGSPSPYSEEKEEDNQGPSARGIYGQTLSQLEVTDQEVEAGVTGTWDWAKEDQADKTYPIVEGTTSYTRVFTPENQGQEEIRVKVVPKISFLETDKKATILSPSSPDGENGWYKGNVVLEAPDGFQIFHSRSVGWVEELVVEDDGGSGDYEYYLREVGTNLTTGVKTVRLNIDSRPPVVESATVTHVENGTRIRVKGREDTALTEQVSGVRQFYCLVVREESAKELSPEAVLKNRYTKSTTTGEFTYTDINSGTRCELYVVVADKAGNLSKVSTQAFTAQ